MELTPQQKRTVESRNKDILVSASAGSGKTAVLVKRVISRITDPDAPCDITRFIIVTYTNAAAAEMRSRIAAAINSALASDPGNSHLKRQLGLIPTARISTVHAFCLRLIRENFQTLGIDPSFRLADEDESAALRQEVAAETVAEGYGEPLFDALSANISSLRGDGELVAAVLSVHDMLVSADDADGRFKLWRERAGDRESLARGYLDSLLPETEFRLKMAEISLDELDCSEDERLKSAYFDVFADDLSRLRGFAEALKGDWDGARSALAALSAFDNLKPARGVTDTELADRLKRSRKRLKDFAARIENGILSLPWEDAERDAKATEKLAERFFELVKTFSDRYAQAKLERGIADFSDLEQLALRLLVRDGRPTDLARTVGNSADELMVDEFQDTNSAQSAVFRALTEETSCAFFAVGDVKQSIYRFRQADPTIFLRHRETAGERIYLDRNFRSFPNVIDAVNAVFSRLMSESFGEVDYGATETLSAGLADPGNSAKASLEIIDLSRSDGERLSAAQAEAEYTANRIGELLASGSEVYDKELGRTRPLCPSDIAVLLRSAKEQGRVMAAAFEKAGLTSVGGGSESLLDSADIVALTDLLSAVDNPTREPTLAGAMLSPLVGFTPDEMGRIRLCGGRESFYTCLKTAAEGEDALGEKCRGFLSLLERLRYASGSMTVGELVSLACELTGAVAAASAAAGGGARRENLEEFFATAAAWGDARPSATVGDFLRYVERNRKKGGGKARTAGEGVHIMSVHSSKGLEFPVVILAGLAKRTNLRWKTSPLQIHPNAGAGFMIRDGGSFTERTTLCRELAAELLEREQLSEELRILYVAMTRARERLIMIAAFENAEKKLLEVSEENACGVSPEYCRRAPSFAEWLLAAVSAGGSGDVELSVHPPKKTGAYEAEVPSRPQPDADLTARIADMLKKSEGLWPTPTPAKLTATQYKRLTLGQEMQQGPTAYRQPKFISGMGGRLTPAERGTAMHLVMQLIPAERADEQGFAAEFIRGLVEKRILSPAAAAELDPAKVSGFFASEVGRSFKENIARSRREFRFTLPLPADRWTGGQGELLLQGVADLFWEDEEGNITVVDYKTDAVTPFTELERAESYRPQLEVYADAVGKIVGKTVSSSYIYFFETGHTVKVL